MLGTNMLVHPLSRTDEHIEDEHVPYIQSLHFLLTNAPFMDEARHTFDTPLVASSSIGVIHRKGQLSGKKKNFMCHVSQFNWLPVVSISFFEVRATCHFLTGLCRFICPGQLSIYSGIPPLPSTFAKFSPLTFLV